MGTEYGGGRCGTHRPGLWGGGILIQGRGGREAGGESWAVMIAIR